MTNSATDTSSAYQAIGKMSLDASIGTTLGLIENVEAEEGRHQEWHGGKHCSFERHEQGVQLADWSMPFTDLECEVADSNNPGPLRYLEFSPSQHFIKYNFVALQLQQSREK
jgi:hypothetical protein